MLYAPEKENNLASGYCPRLLPMAIINFVIFKPTPTKSQYKKSVFPTMLSDIINSQKAKQYILSVILNYIFLYTRRRIIEMIYYFIPFFFLIFKNQFFSMKFRPLRLLHPFRRLIVILILRIHFFTLLFTPLQLLSSCQIVRDISQNSSALIYT